MKGISSPGSVLAGDGTLSTIRSPRLLRRALLADYRVDEGAGSTLASDSAGAASPGDGLLNLQGAATLSRAGLTNTTNGSGGATGSLPAPVTLAKMSAYWVGRSPVGANQGQGGVFYGDYSSNNFGFKFYFGGASASQAFTFVSFAFGNQTALARLVRLDDNAYHVWGATYDGACVRLYCDEALVGYMETVVSPTTVQAINPGCFFPDGAYTFQGDSCAAMIYGIDHTPAQVCGQTIALQQFVATKGVTVPTLSRFLVAEGDSITQGVNVPANWVQMVATGLVPLTSAVNFAVPSATINPSGSTGPNANNNLVYRAKYVDAAFVSAPAHGVLAVAAGHNDQGYLSAAQSYANYKAYCLARRAAGARKIIACSLLPSDPAVVPGFNAWRNSWNALLYADVAAGGIYDGLID